MRTGKVSYEGKYWNEKPERHRWSRFSYDDLIDKGILHQKSGWTPGHAMAFTDTSIQYLELIESELVRIHRTFPVSRTYERDMSQLTEEERNSLTAPLQQAFGDEFCVWLKTPLPVGYYSVLLPRYAATLGKETPQVAYRQTDIDDDFSIFTYRKNHSDVIRDDADGRWIFEDRERRLQEHIEEMPQSNNVVLVIEHSSDTLKFGSADKAELYALAGIPEYWIYRVQDRVLEVHRDPMQMRDRKLGYGYRSTQQYSSKETVSPLAVPHSQVAVSDIARGEELTRSVW